MTNLWWVLFIYNCLQEIAQIIATLKSDDVAKRSGYFFGVFLNGLMIYFLWMIKDLI